MFWAMMVLLFGLMYITHIQAPKKENYFDIDIINQSIMYYTCEFSNKRTLKPFVDLLSENLSTRKEAIEFLRHMKTMAGNKPKYCSYGFVSYEFKEVPHLLFYITINCNGNKVNIEVYNDHAIQVSDVDMLLDIELLSRECLTFMFYISIFARSLDKLKHREFGLVYLESTRIDEMNKAELHVRHELDYGFAYISREVTREDEPGIDNIILTTHVVIGGMFYRVYTDSVANYYYVNDERVTDRKFRKLFNRGIKQWITLSKLNKEKLLS